MHRRHCHHHALAIAVCYGHQTKSSIRHLQSSSFFLFHCWGCSKWVFEFHFFHPWIPTICKPKSLKSNVQVATALTIPLCYVRGVLHKDVPDVSKSATHKRKYSAYVDGFEESLQPTKMVKKSMSCPFCCCSPMQFLFLDASIAVVKRS
ncbi:uncharacterized protein LOC129311724 [Prosopis cineraria]|uniref:uncharacterized protein LOC129311724 n=1 Tax=Prosopis cineraria TaxID=364024 RepID=UPI00240ED358|nr:uncharacterized protein LOC129311724 [Prosopis cineraria]